MAVGAVFEGALAGGGSLAAGVELVVVAGGGSLAAGVELVVVVGGGSLAAGVELAVVVAGAADVLAVVVEAAAVVELPADEDDPWPPPWLHPANSAVPATLPNNEKMWRRCTQSSLFLASMVPPVCLLFIV